MNTFVTSRTAGPRFKFALPMLAGGLACALAGTAGAAAMDEVPSIVVRYDSQALATDDGVRKLYRRIVAAAGQVCPDAPIGYLTATQRVKQCRAQAIARAIGQINDARLAALYAAYSKSG
jgi:UrcA family protein